MEHPGQDDNCAHGVVEESAYMGGLSIYHVTLDSGLRVRVTQPNLTRAAAERLTWEDEVYLGWHASSGVVLTA